MPIPIRPVGNTGNQEENKVESQFDYSILLSGFPKTDSNTRIVTASDSDASMLLELWARSEKTDKDMLKISKESSLSSNDIIRLKSHGLITGGTEEVKLTGRGKAVITTMVLGENNNFLKDKKQKSYTEILASMSKKGKPGYRIPTISASSHLIRLPKQG